MAARAPDRVETKTNVAGLLEGRVAIIVDGTPFVLVCPFLVRAVFHFSIAFRMLRFPLMALSASFGLLGILFGLILLALHLSTLSSFGVPYMQSLDFVPHHGPVRPVIIYTSMPWGLWELTNVLVLVVLVYAAYLLSGRKKPEAPAS